MHSVNSVFVEFLEHHEIKKPKTYINLNNKNVKYDYMPEFTTATTKQQVKKISSGTLSKQTNKSV